MIVDHIRRGVHGHPHAVENIQADHRPLAQRDQARERVAALEHKIETLEAALTEALDHWHGNEVGEHLRIAELRKLVTP